MSRTRPLQNTFSSGEIDPLLLARNDFMRYKTGLAVAKGFVPMRQGPVSRAPGTYYKGTTRGNSTAVRIPFVFAQNDAVELEFSDGIMRVWRYNQLVTVGNTDTVYELVTPYTEADLPNLDTAQNGDVIYIVDGRQEMQKLSRYALDNWTIEGANLERGPFQNQNLDEAVTMTFSAATGVIDVTVAADLFEASHVGAIFLIKPTDFNDVPIWVGNFGASVGSLWRYDGNIYELTNGENTGVTAPIHTEGTVLTDPEQEARYRWVSDETGIIKISGVTDARHATATVIKTLPQPAIDDPTYRWAEGAWSDRAGWPNTIAIAERRLFAAATAKEPRTLWASLQADYLDFLPSSDADGSFAYIIDADGEKNRIVWLARGRRGLFIGALGEVWRGFSAVSGEAIGPTTFDVEEVSPDGAAAIAPIPGRGDPIYVPRDKTRVHEIQYSFQNDGSEPIELSLPSQHLTALGIEQIIWQSAPAQTAWLRTSTGILAMMIYDPKQEVLGWARIPLAGGVVENISVSPSSDGARDVVTMIVRRTINGSVVRCIEELADNGAVWNGTEGLEKANHLFCAYVHDGAEILDFDVPHLAGETASAWTNRGNLGDVSVGIDGSVILPDAVSHLILGLFDDTHYGETLPILPMARDGDARGRKTKLSGRVGLVVHKTVGGRISAVEREFGTVERVATNYDINAGRVATNEPVITSGVILTHPTSGFTEDVRLRFSPRGGEPLIIQAIVGDAEEVGA